MKKKISCPTCNTQYNLKPESTGSTACIKCGTIWSNATGKIIDKGEILKKSPGPRRKYDEPMAPLNRRIPESWLPLIGDSDWLRETIRKQLIKEGKLSGG